MGEDAVLADLAGFDKANMRSELERFPLHIKEGYNLVTVVPFKGPFTDIVCLGMGGSAISADLLACYLPDLPIVSCRAYRFPVRLGKKPLVLAVSYSGNTEETLSAFREAARATKDIVVFSSGGRLEEASNSYRLPSVRLPRGHQPRNAVPFMFFSMLSVLERAGLTPSHREEVERVAEDLAPRKVASVAASFVGRAKNRTILVYASEEFFPLAFRWKTSFNENSKVMAFANRLPELNHNELAGFTRLKEKYVLFLLRTDEEHRRVHKRMDLTKEFATKAGIEVVDIALKGGRLSKIMTAVLLGDWLSYYLALQHKVDPSPVKIIERFKEKMGIFV